MDNSYDKSIAIVHPSSTDYIETFVQHHIDYLPYRILELKGGFLPNKIGKGKDLSSKLSKILLLVSLIVTKLFGEDKLYFHHLALKRVLKKNKIKLVLAEFGPTGTAMLPVCEKLGIPLIVYFLGYDASKKKIILENASYKSLFSKSVALIGVSKSICDKLKELGCPPDKIHYNFCGAIDLFFEKEIPSTTPLVLVSIGRFVPKKAPYLTIMAFAEVLKEVPDAKLKMIGSGTELFDSCFQLIKMYGIEANVELLGNLSPKQISKILESTRAFVQHSIEAMDGDSEGTPVAILEVGAQGIPVISTFHSGIPEVVVHGLTGFLVKERDVVTMKKYMVEVLKNEELARTIGQNARIHVKENFHINRSIEKLTGIIENSIALND